MGSEKSLCMQCMLEIDSQESICPYCGYSTLSKQAEPYLPHGIRIRGRYLVGKMIKRNVDSAVYIGFDCEKEKTIELREFFPSKISVREKNKNSVTFAENRKDLFDEYLQSFVQLWKNLMRFKGLPALFDVLEVFEEGGTAYAVTDHNDSTTFRKILDTMNVENNPFSLKRTTSLIVSILSTVESLHTANVVHRGISPETLILSSDGTLKITGFAIPQVRTTKNKLVSAVCDGYAAIEQYDFNWQQGSWTDIYSIGALLYKMLTGRTLPPAPARLNDEELFFTDEERERIPLNIIELIKDCLVLMPQGRMKDIHDIVNVFKPQEASKKTVTAMRGRNMAAGVKTTETDESEAETADSKKPEQVTAPTIRPANVILSEKQKLAERKRKEALEPKRFVKPKQAEAATKTTISKNSAIIEQQKEQERIKAEEERRRREELLKKQQEEKEQREKERLEAEKRRKLLEEERERKKLERREKHKKQLEKSVAVKAAEKINDKATETKQKIKKKLHREVNPVSLAVTIGVFVSITSVLLTFLVYGTVLYKYVDAPVLDNCLSHISFLPVNGEKNEIDDADMVAVADFRTLTRELIESEPLYSKDYNIEFEYDYCDDVEKGYVFSQSVDPGNKIPEGSTVRVYISKGIKLVTFIDVIGMQYSEAESQLTQLGFTVTKNEIYNIGIYTQDKVTSASLKAGDEYPMGTEVTLNVWSAPPITLPSTTQQSQSETQPQQPGQSETESTTQSQNQSQWPQRQGGLFSFWRNILGF